MERLVAVWMQTERLRRRRIIETVEQEQFHFSGSLREQESSLLPERRWRQVAMVHRVHREKHVPSRLPFFEKLYQGVQGAVDRRGNTGLLTEAGDVAIEGIDLGRPPASDVLRRGRCRALHGFSELQHGRR